MTTSPSSSPLQQVSPAIRARAKRMVANLKRCYRLGRLANSRRNELSTVEFADKHGINEHTMRKYCAFAREYDAAELRELCSLRRPSGVPLQWGHVPYFLAIRDKRVRKDYQDRAAREDWTAPVLCGAIRHLACKSTSDHGRPMKKPTTPAAGLQQIMDDGDLWRRRCEFILDELSRIPNSHLDRAARRAAVAASKRLIYIAKTVRKIAIKFKAIG